MVDEAKPRLLLIEFGSHLLGLQEMARMLESNWRLTFAIRHQNKSSSWREEFIYFSRYSRSAMLHAQVPRFIYSVTKVRWLARIIGDSLFFGRILLMVFFSRRVLITTGPENGGRIEIAILWLIVFLRRGRVILNVRDGGDYMKALRFETRDSWSKTVTSLFRRVTRFAFETEGVRKTFLDVLRSDSITGVIPWMMSDMVFDRRNETSPKSEIFGSPISIGLLGTIDNSRRDYETVVRALLRLSSGERKRIKFLFLAGPPPQTDVSDLRNQVSNLVEAEFPYGPGFSQCYFARGSACDVLLAPLKQEAGYGRTKGSGAFGDLLALRKKLIAPAMCDPMGEFSAFSHYYRDASELTRIFQRIISDPFFMLTMNPTEYDKWSAPSVYKRNTALFL